MAGQSEPGGPHPLRVAVEDEFGPTDPLARALAIQLADIGVGRNAAAVSALRALGEFVSVQRQTLRVAR
jgi:hypothetical protein